MYKYRQIYKAENEDLCNKWIERINAAIIYYKFWKNLIDKNSEIWEYYSKQSEIEEMFEIGKTVSKKEGEKEEEKGQSSIVASSYNNSQVEVTEKNNKDKKKRRKNPFSNLKDDNQGSNFDFISR